MAGLPRPAGGRRTRRCGGGVEGGGTRARRGSCCACARGDGQRRAAPGALSHAVGGSGAQGVGGRGARPSGQWGEGGGEGRGQACSCPHARGSIDCTQRVGPRAADVRDDAARGPTLATFAPRGPRPGPCALGCAVKRRTSADRALPPQRGLGGWRDCALTSGRVRTSHMALHRL